MIHHLRPLQILTATEWKPNPSWIFFWRQKLQEFLFLGVLFWASLNITISAWEIGETTMTHWGPIYYPLRTTLPVACFLFLMQVVAKLIRDIAILIQGEDIFPVRETLI